MKTSLAALVLAAAVNASAQVVRAPEPGSAAVVAGQVAAVRASADAGRARARALETTLTALNDGIEAGGRVTAWITDKQVSVYTATQPEAAKTVVAGGKTAIVLSDALPAHPRVYGPLIAHEAAQAIYADMPASGERSYMVMATAARVFAELGGDFNALPTVDGDAAPAVKAVVEYWLDSPQGVIDELARRDGVKIIPDLQQEAKDPKTAAALDAANRRFVAFLLDERDARQALKR